MLAWIAPHQGILNVWVRRMGEAPERARVLTADRGRGIHDFFWQADSRHIIYERDHDGDENWVFYQISAEGAEKLARQLTPTGAQALLIARRAQFPGRIVIALNGRDARFHDAYLLDLSSGQKTLLAQNPGDVEYFVADQKLQVRAALARLPDGSAEIRVRDISGGEWRRLAGWTADDVDGELLAFSPDDQAVWYTSSLGSDTGRLLETDVKSSRTRLLAEDSQQQFDAGKILVHPRTRALEAVQFNRERNHWEATDAAIAKDFAVLEKAHRGDFSVLSADDANQIWTVAYTVDDGPTYYYLYDRRGRKATLLFSNRPALEKYKLAEMRPVKFAARDGLVMHGYLTLPVLPAAQQKDLPLIVYPHGGPYQRDDWGYNDDAQLLANRGYAVLQINYRGSTGYGKKFLQAAFRERGGKMSTDLLDGKNWAVQQGYADAKRSCIYGVSYGGYAVLVAVAFTPEEFVCGVEAYGASNLVSLLQSFPPWWSLYRLQWERRVGYAKEEEFLKSRSALFQVQNIRVPLLIGQGVNDPRVAKSESDQMVAALRKNGKEVTYIVFPDEGHGFVRPENQERWYAAVEAFLAKQLGGRAEPPGTDGDWKKFEQ
ncbi:MAG: S9 family peptidase [Acidobacteria bacterium]|nr:S9 family peptidase [Acidobacteriota bacterium]